MRTFIAVNLEQDIRTEVERLQRDLKNMTSGFRWVKSELLHITLKFLGDIDPAAVSNISRAMDLVTHNHTSFTLSFAGMGAFPTWKKPRIVWIGMGKGASEMTALALDIDKALQEVAWENDKEQGQKKGGKKDIFKPHLTLGRAKNNETAHISRDILNIEWRSAGTLCVDGFFLMESNLFPSGPVYRPVRKFLLK